MWGDVIREQKSDIASYRYGYQGQFAEKDDETGWNHFELREYDAVVGRWLSRDIARQFYSPYLGLGNNPISYIDPDGAYSFLGASLRRGWDIVRGKSVGELYSVEGDWGYNIITSDFEWYFNVGYERDTSGDKIFNEALEWAGGGSTQG